MIKRGHKLCWFIVPYHILALSCTFWVLELPKLKSLKVKRWREEKKILQGTVSSSKHNYTLKFQYEIKFNQIYRCLSVVGQAWQVSDIPRDFSSNKQISVFIWTIMHPVQQKQHLLGHPAMVSINLAGKSGIGAVQSCLDFSQTKWDAWSWQHKRSSGVPAKVAMSSGRQLRKESSDGGEGRETVTLAKELS